MTYYAKRQQLLVGLNGRLRIFNINENEVAIIGEIIDPKFYSAHAHTDIISAVMGCEGRIYSTGHAYSYCAYAQI